MKLSHLILLTASCVTALVSCGKSATETKNDNKIIVGVMSGAEAQVAEVAKKIAKEQYDLEVELVTFSDFAIPNAALADGSLDINAFQHRPYLDKQIADRGYEITAVANTFVYPLAAYSKKIKTSDQITDKAKVAIPNDPSNLSRALKIMAKQNLITLDPSIDEGVTTLDITANPKNLEILEVKASQLPRVLEEVQFALINNTYATQAGLTVEEHGLFVEDKDSPYVNLIVARKDNQNDEKVQTFIKAYQTEEVYQEAKKLFNNTIVKGW